MIVRSENMRRVGEAVSPQRRVAEILGIFGKNRGLSREKLVALAPSVNDAIRTLAEGVLRKQGCPNPEIDALEVAQTWWVKMLERGLSAYDPSREFAPYVMAIARHSCRDIGRDIERRKEVEMFPSWDPNGASPFVLAMHQEVRRQVWKAVARLPRVMRQIIICRHWLGMRSRQVATRLEIRETAVDRLAFNARKRLSKELGLLQFKD